MKNSITLCTATPLPIGASAITPKNKSMISNTACCAGDGRLAFAMPWSVITVLGAVSAAGQPMGVYFTGAFIPGLLAGTTGLIAYKATKHLVRTVRRLRFLKKRLSIAKVCPHM